MWNKIITSRITLWVAVAVLILALVGGAALFLTLEFQIPYQQAQNHMPADGILELFEEKDGTVRIQWPEGINADSYTVQVLDPATGTELFSMTTRSVRSCQLPVLPTNKELTLRISSAADYRDTQRPGDTALERTVTLAAPRIEIPTCTIDPDTDTVYLRFDLEKSDSCRMYITGESGITELLETLTTGEATLQFGKDQIYHVPAFDKNYTLEFDVCREIPGISYQGQVCAQLELCREDFLGTVLKLEHQDLGSNAFALHWNETKGEHYEVQQLVKDQWTTLERIERDGVLTYETGHLEKFSSFTFRVIAVGGQVETNAPIESEPLSVTTGAATVYSTIWPLMELDIYSDPESQQIIGKAPAGKAYCVLADKNGRFGIRHGDTIGYIDSNYCLINLPEYMGDLCAYEIANSHHAIYMVHDYEIDKVTDTVIKGYEKVELSKQNYLVPLLYPAAKKLVQAAFTAQDQGYMLKIYDSFRPRQATTSIYDLTAKIIGDPVPEYTFKEKKEMMEAGNWPPPEPTVPEPTDPETGEPGETTPEATVPTEPTEPVETYEMLMTDKGRYALANFLAQGTSNHNIGVALDLTLINLYTGQEVKMQTAIHDLSWHSEVKLNNADAKRLRSIMTSAGFGPLESEWWHFQDNDAKKELKLYALEQGISAECWMMDDTGWRYRTSDGKYFKNCEKSIDGVWYRFDANGYVTE